MSLEAYLVNRVPCRHDRGLTLIELLVVVVILATLAQTALVTADRLVDEERFERTTDALENAEIAILGRRNVVDPSGRLWAEGHVADVGRLPIVRSITPGEALQDLWIRETNVTPFGLQNATGDPAVSLPCGWRGPYLQLGIGKSAWFDGWGAAFIAKDESGDVAQVGEPVAGIRSRGADLEDGGDGYAEDLEVAYPTVGATRHLGVIPVRVLPLAGAGGQLVVRVYGPENGKLVTLLQQVVATGASTSIALAFVDVSIGPRVVRAYQTDTPPPTKDLPIGAGVSSKIEPIVVVAGGIPELVIDMADS